MKSNVISNDWFTDENNRLDAKFHLSDGLTAKRLLSKKGDLLRPLSSVTSQIFMGPRFKRYYVDNSKHGLPFMGGATMQKNDLTGLKLISKKMTKCIDELKLEAGWTLVTRSGTIGQTAFTTKDFEGKAATEDVIRVIANQQKIKPGFLHAYLTSKYGYALLTQGTYGAVIQHIEPHHIADLPVPIFPKPLEQQIHQLITEAAELRVGANELLEKSQRTLLKEAVLPQLSSDEYEFFGNHAAGRKLSVFSVSSSEINSVSINAFNYSRRIKALRERVKKATKSIPLIDGLQEPGFFSTGSFPRVELDSPNAVQLINQTDIFNIRMVGKRISPRKVKTDKLVNYGEVLIAGVGTLGENETFCRVIFAGEELTGKLISGEFIRMKTNSQIPSGYLYAWLSSDYGFRFIRSTQTGTKLCRPIQAMLQEIPVPVLDENEMKKIDTMVKQAHTKRFQALEKENQAIAIMENEINSWQYSKHAETMKDR